jgi:hypothetical protein
LVTSVCSNWRRTRASLPWRSMLSPGRSFSLNWSRRNWGPCSFYRLFFFLFWKEKSFPLTYSLSDIAGHQSLHPHHGALHPILEWNCEDYYNQLPLRHERGRG